jgi:Sec-independent protein translocase protein TatA
MIALLTITVVLIVMVVLFALATGRRSGSDAKKTIEAVRNAEEVKDEVEALASDTLRDRARTWVRRPKG